MGYLGPSFLNIIEPAVQQGRGAAASVLGQTYNVYRLGGTTNNSIVSGTPAITGFQARLRRSKKIAIENQTFDLLVYTAMCDSRSLQLQDVLVETGYESDGGTFVYAQHRPTRETLFVRTEFNVSVTRPMPLAGRSSQFPTSGNLRVSGYSAIDRDTEWPLTLSGGLFAFAQSGTQCSLPAGLQPLNRVRDGSSLGTPTDLYREHFLIYLPMIPGDQLNELDRIAFPNSAGAPDRYECMSIYTSDMTGFSGYIIIAEKLGN